MFILQNEKKKPELKHFYSPPHTMWAWELITSHVLKPTAYLHQRNKDAAEVARRVRLNGFLQRLLVGCEAWVHGYGGMQSLLDSAISALRRRFGFGGSPAWYAAFMACISALLLVTRISMRACSSVPAPCLHKGTPKRKQTDAAVLVRTDDETAVYWQIELSWVLLCEET